MLTKPRTVCACQPAVAMISANAAPFAAFSMAILKKDGQCPY
jgi:hypothetical protein